MIYRKALIAIITSYNFGIACHVMILFVLDTFMLCNHTVVRQGGNLSPTFFFVYVVDLLLIFLIRKWVDVFIGSECQYGTCIIKADDVCLILKSRSITNNVCYKSSLYIIIIEIELNFNLNLYEWG